MLTIPFAAVHKLHQKEHFLFLYNISYELLYEDLSSQ